MLCVNSNFEDIRFKREIIGSRVQCCAFKGSMLRVQCCAFKGSTFNPSRSMLAFKGSMLRVPRFKVQLIMRELIVLRLSCSCHTVVTLKLCASIPITIGTSNISNPSVPSNSSNSSNPSNPLNPLNPYRSCPLYDKLKLLLQIGKSEISLFLTESASASQLWNEGSFIL